MKRSAVAGGAVLVILAVAGVGLGLRSSGHKPAPAVPLTAAGPLSVDDFMHGPEGHPGKVRVEGVVSTVAPDEHLLTLIDRKEWEACGEVDCAPLSLPVRWSGPMPKIEDGVEISGRVADQAGKLVFVAETLTPVPLGRATGR